jgi:hypothetical protein
VYTSGDNKRGPGREVSPVRIHAPPPRVAEIEVPTLIGDFSTRSPAPYLQGPLSGLASPDWRNKP